MRSFPIAPYLLTLLAFIFLAVMVTNIETPPLDQRVFDIIHGLRAPLVDSLMRSISFLGETGPSIIVAAPFAVWLWVKGFRREAVWFVIALSVVALATGVVKNLVDRTRPDGGGLSFVSGHTSYFTVFSGYLFFALKRLVGDSRWLGAWRIALVLLVVLTGISRVYLGVHWPSDVLGGFLLGILVLVPVLRRVDTPPGIQS
jgi:undecaprenyl-diphosphatase